MRLLVLGLLSACASQGAPAVAIERVDPGSGKSSEDVPVRLEGTFHLPLSSDLENQRTTVGDVTITIDGVPLRDVVWRDEHLIEGTVPAGLTPGAYDVNVILGARSAVLEGGYVALGQPTALAFLMTATSPACTCSGAVTLEVRDESDHAVTVETPTPIGLLSDSATLTFFSDAACTVAVTDVTIAAGASSVDFFFSESVLGAPTLTASSAALAAVSQTASVPPNPAPWYLDRDLDGFGDASLTSAECAAPVGFVASADDCDDDPSACGAGCFPGNSAADVCDGFDQDCDPTSADGSGDPQLGAMCDGADSDLCREGTLSCQSSALMCSDATGSTVEGPVASPSCSDLIDNDCDGLMDVADSSCIPCIQLACTGAGGTCVGDTCVIDENTPGRVTCPAGMNCQVLCDADGACDAGVFCGAATSCDVRCLGFGACKANGVDCGQAATCNVRCEGATACEHGTGGASVECRDADCTVTCTGANACKDGIAVGTGGTCVAHCCNGACEAGTATCNADNVCN